MRLTGSVGQGGRNVAGDVLYVQILLSDWLLLRDKAALALDGKVGNQTLGAIRDFQRANHIAVVDGLVEPSRSTIKALESLHVQAIRKFAVMPPTVGFLPGVGSNGGGSPAKSFFDVYLAMLRG